MQEPGISGLFIEWTWLRMFDFPLNRIDKTNPKGLGEAQLGRTVVTFDAIILSHDYASRRHAAKTVIGTHCFIGCGSIILPNITIGNRVMLAAGSVVTTDIPDNCIVAGNPAKVMNQ